MKTGVTKGTVTNCYTQDGIEINVYYALHYSYRKSHFDKLEAQIIQAFRYVFRYYPWYILKDNSSHQAHIERQIKNCLNENYQQETEPLSKSGITIKKVELLNLDEKR